MLDVPDWLVDFLDGVSLWDAIAILGIIVAVVWFIAKKGWRGVMTFARAILATAEVIDNVKELPKFIERTDQTLADHTGQLEGIYHETHNNDGSSIKDQTGRIEVGVKGLHGRMDAVEQSIATLSKEDESLWAAIEDTQNPHDPEEES